MRFQQSTVWKSVIPRREDASGFDGQEAGLPIISGGVF